MNIVYCTDIVYELSGIDVITITKANALAEIPDNHVWIVVAGNPRSLVNRLKRVSVIELPVNYYTQDQKGVLNAIWDIFQKRKLHKQKLSDFLENVQPDVVISTGVLVKYFLPTMKISSNPVFIRELHTDRHYILNSATTWSRKLIALLSEWYDYGWKIHRYDKIVVLTEKEKSGLWKYWNKVVTIPNPLTYETGLMSDGDSKIVITGGRLAKMKNFSELVEIWVKVSARHPDWLLQIWGIGTERDALENQIQRLGLSNQVSLMGYTSEMPKEMSKASLMVLTSMSESFSLVTLEAMSVGIPTVVYNCPGGIRYLVKDSVTGYLVPLHDDQAFAERVCELIEDEEKRKRMGHAAQKESEQYKIEQIIPYWMELFQELLDKKRREK